MLASYGSTFDVVWSLWSKYVDRLEQMKCLPYHAKQRIPNFEQCVKMTDGVLTQGYDTENLVCYNENRADTLFDVIHCLSCVFEVPNRGLEYLLKLGYDIEKRDDAMRSGIVIQATRHPTSQGVHQIRSGYRSCQLERRRCS